MKYVDLSLPLENDDAWSPWWARNRVTYQGHRFGAFVIRFLFGARKEHLKTELGWANENIALSTHGTTHMDAPLAAQAEAARKSGRSDVFWAAHYVGVENEYCHMERLANLGQLPATGFTICAFPLKVNGGSAGPARVVAIIEEATP